MKAIRKHIRSLFVGVALIVMPFIYLGCGGSPAGPPSPPVEVPSPVVLKFVPYEDIRIDVSTIASEASTSINVYDAVGAGGEYSEEIAAGPNIIREVDEILSIILTGLNAMEVPVGEDVTTYTAEMAIDYSGEDGEDVETFTAKIDFSDFDFDGDGASEGCSGHTAALPICARLWLEDYRYLAWVFEDYPEAGDPGKGKFKLYTGGALGITVPTIRATHYSWAIGYDHRDEENRLNEILRFIETFEVDAEAEDGQHVQLTQVGPASSALKSINFVRESMTWYLPRAENPDITGTLSYIGQFIEGQDLWAGSWDATGVFQMYGFNPLTVDNLCAVISTGDAAADPNDCDALGISVAGIPYVDVATMEDVQFYDFPELPTF